MTKKNHIRRSKRGIKRGHLKGYTPPYGFQGAAAIQRGIAQALDRSGQAKLGTSAHELADKLTQLSLREDDADSA